MIDSRGGLEIKIVVVTVEYEKIDDAARGKKRKVEKGKLPRLIEHLKKKRGLSNTDISLDIIRFHLKRKILMTLKKRWSQIPHG